MDVTWDTKLTGVVGAKTAKALDESFGHVTVGDLLSHWPRRHIRRGGISSVDELVEDEHATVVARVASSSLHTYTDRRTHQQAYRVECVVELDDGRVHMTFFDRRRSTAEWRTGHLRAGTVATFEGKATRDRFKNAWQLVHPHCDVLDRAESAGGEDVIGKERASLSGMQPIYPAAKKITSWAIEAAVRVVLDVVGELPEVLPAEVVAERTLVPGQQALRWIHRPENWHELVEAQRRLRFEEAFVVQTVLAQRRARLSALDARPRTGRDGGLLDQFDSRLPFELTEGQQQVGHRLLEDLAADHPMHVLLQGEVGSGKTVVALRAMLRVVDSGGQAVLLAPTEVLAQQHPRSISRMLGDLAGGGMLGAAADATGLTLLTGSLGAAARREAMLDAASGAAGIVVGTHALLEDRVQFADLGLVVVDEQHRFGVEQRAALSAKAGEIPPHVLVMTATPIPRTVAMTVFGDLDVVELTELPAGRAEIQSTVVPLAEQPGWIERVWGRLREEVQRGHQVYVVCPRIGDDAKADPDEEPPADLDKDESPLAAVDEVATMLADGPLAGLRLATLHGRMPPDAKDHTMRAFAAGELDVLVATTVIEVGVDVPNATTMVILDADRFGISQLHQLRGRVGRGGLHGLCLLVSRASVGSLARERLDVVAGTTDGFALSEADLDLRSEGDVLGTSQSGRRSSLRMLRVREHADVIAEAREAAGTVVAADPDLVGHPLLAAEIQRLEESDQADFLDKG